MNTPIEKLNEILSCEWACVRTLRRAESVCDDPAKLEVIKRVRKDCSVSCANLAAVIRGLGGSPTDIPSARFSMKLTDESLGDAMDLAQSAQGYIVDEINSVIDDPELKSALSHLDTIRQLHKEDMRWLKSALAQAG